MVSKKKQVILLYISTLAGILVGMLSSVINTRVLEPALFGDVRYIQNIISFISSLLLFGYFTSGSRLLALSKDKEYSCRIRGAMCTILGIAQFIIMLAMLCLYLFYNYNGDSIAPLYLIIMPVCGNVIMLSYINTTAQGDNHIGRIALARLLPTSIYVTVAYFIYQKYNATPALMLLLYNGIAVVTFISIIFSTRPTFKDLRTSFKILNEENKKYGFHVYTGSIAAVSTGYLAGITLGIFCEDNTEVGFYTLAQTLSAPLAMLPTIIGTTYFKKFANEVCISKKVMWFTILITFFSLFAFILLIDIVVEFLYEESYSQVSTIAIWLAVAVSIHGFGDMINRFLSAHGKGKEQRNTSFLCGMEHVLGNLILVYLWGINGAIATKLLTSITFTGFLYYHYHKYIKFHKQ